MELFLQGSFWSPGNTSVLCDIHIDVHINSVIFILHFHQLSYKGWSAEYIVIRWFSDICTSKKFSDKDFFRKLGQIHRQYMCNHFFLVNINHHFTWGESKLFQSCKFPKYYVHVCLIIFHFLSTLWMVTPVSEDSPFSRKKMVLFEKDSFIRKKQRMQLKLKAF